MSLLQTSHKGLKHCNAVKRWRRPPPPQKKKSTPFGLSDFYLFVFTSSFDEGAKERAREIGASLPRVTSEIVCESCELKLLKNPAGLPRQPVTSTQRTGGDAHRREEWIRAGFTLVFVVELLPAANLNLGSH